MKASEDQIRKWVQIIKNDLRLFDNEDDIFYIATICKYTEFDILPNDAGVIGYLIHKDFDCKKKMSVVLLYCKPEYRGKYLRYMMRRIEEIAKQEGANKISIGSSISGYKQEKFGRMLEYFCYRNNGYIKEI